MKKIKSYTKKILTSYLIFLIVFSIISPAGFAIADDATPSVTVGNATPVASGVSLNGDATITLTENTTKAVTVTGTVTDNNSCLDLTSVIVIVKRFGTTCAVAGDADADNCYVYTYTTPSTDASCTGVTDMTFAVSHEFSIQYYADGGTWLASIIPADEGAGTGGDSSSVTLSDLQSLNVDAAISFGSVSVGEASTGDHGATVSNTGNVAIDLHLSGGALTCDGRGTIPVGNQEYSLTSSFTYTAGTDLSATATDLDAALAANESDSSPLPIVDEVYWQVAVPTGVEGTCTGTTTFAAIAAI